MAKERNTTIIPPNPMDLSIMNPKSRSPERPSTEVMPEKSRAFPALAMVRATASSFGLCSSSSLPQEGNDVQDEDGDIGDLAQEEDGR